MVHFLPLRLGEDLRWSLRPHGPRPCSSPPLRPRRSIRSFVKDVAARPGRATIYYDTPSTEENDIGGADIADIVLSRQVMSSVECGGPHRT